MYCIGLTGGIGSGKSSAAAEFEALGVAVVDTDAIAHELTAPGGAAMEALRNEFGPEYVTAEGALDRQRMRELVFSDADAKRRLEQVLHPRIRSDTQARLAAARAPYVMVVVPLLLETGAYRDQVDRILVVDCEESTQIARTMARSKLTAEQVRAIMAAQIPRPERLARADDVVSNEGDLEALHAQVHALHSRYLAFAAARANQ